MCCFLFNNRYAAFGGFLAFKGSSSIGKRIKRLLVDGEEVAVPKNAKALIVLNIPSYAGEAGTAGYALSQPPLVSPISWKSSCPRDSL